MLIARKLFCIELSVPIFLISFIRKVAAAFRVVAGRKAVEPNLSKKLVELNHHLDDLFISKEVMMKIRPKGDTGESDDDTEIDEQGYKDQLAVGVRKK